MERSIETTEQRRTRAGTTLRSIPEYKAWALRREIELAELAEQGETAEVRSEAESLLKEHRVHLQKLGIKE